MWRAQFMTSIYFITVVFQKKKWLYTSADFSKHQQSNQQARRILVYRQSLLLSHYNKMHFIPNM